MNLLVVLDIDATIADAGWRNKLAGPEPARKDWKKYKKWLGKIQSKKMLMKDKPVLGMCEMSHLLAKHAVYITARQSSYRKVTEKWLKKNKFPKLKLHMRPKKCRKSSGEYKEEVIKNILQKSNKLLSVVIIDDDPKGCIFEAAKRNSWTMLKALSGS
jgi:hypothetical protein